MAMPDWDSPKYSALVTFAVALLFLSLFSDRAFAAQDVLAQVISVDGVGEARLSQADAWRGARVGEGLNAGNEVRTGELSRLGLLFSDRTQLRMSEKTFLQLRASTVKGERAGGNLLRLDFGRVFARSKTPQGPITIETPSATAAIRGTDWELETGLEGKTLLVVITGVVEFSNSYGSLSVSANEAAVAEVGKAPAMVKLVSPKDRVQWVSAHAVDPLRHIYFVTPDPVLASSLLEAARRENAGAGRIASLLADLGRWEEAEATLKAGGVPGGEAEKALFSLIELRLGKLDEAEKALGGAPSEKSGFFTTFARAALAVYRWKMADARSLLSESAGSPPQPAPFLLLADLALLAGDFEAASSSYAEAAKRFPDDARVDVDAARALLLQGRVEEAAKALERARESKAGTYEALLFRGELAYLNGDAPAALSAYEKACAQKPGDDRCWYGIGAVLTGLEDVSPARKNLASAIERKPAEPGYWGERGALETFADEFGEAESNFAEALRLNPSDYKSLTGQGLLFLKEGRDEEALEALLKASILEPRYARAHVFLGVAWYRLGHPSLAMEEFQIASRVDERDSLPYFLASMVSTDYLKPGEAIRNAREAERRMPYLKSLNQVASDRKGSGNLGRAFAYFGQEERARHYAAQSYLPFWAGSHLFLADRYESTFTKTSELYQGYLTDPTAFGPNSRYQTLAAKPGVYPSAGYRAGQDSAYRVSVPYAQLNGFGNSVMPLAAFAEYEKPSIRTLDASPEYESDMDSLVAALGARPNHALGLFLFGAFERYEESVDGVIAGLPLKFDDSKGASDRVDCGFNYAFSPTNQAWVKVGWGERSEKIEDGKYNTLLADIDDATTMRDAQFRHTFEVGRALEVTWGAEWGAQNRKPLVSLPFHDPDGIDPDGIYNLMDEKDDESSGAYVNVLTRPFERLTVEAGAFWQKHDRESAYTRIFDPVDGPPFAVHDRVDEEFSHNEVNGRAGFVWTFGAEGALRAAWQDWRRPSSPGSLSPVATAGIPLDAYLVQSGGKLRKAAAQVEYSPHDAVFATLFALSAEVDNEPYTRSFLTTPEVEELARLRERSYSTLSNESLIEHAPEFGEGTIKAWGGAANFTINDSLSAFVRYRNTASENTGRLFDGLELPYMPRHALAVGYTWVYDGGLYFASKATFRSERFADEANLVKIDPGWDVSSDLFLELFGRRCVLRVGADSLLDRNKPEFYSGDVTFRY